MALSIIALDADGCSPLSVTVDEMAEDTPQEGWVRVFGIRVRRNRRFAEGEPQAVSRTYK